jgi:hypothetical protein
MEMERATKNKKVKVDVAKIIADYNPASRLRRSRWLLAVRRIFTFSGIE